MSATAPLRSDETPFESTPPEILVAMGGRLPTFQQWQAISHPLTPCCIVAGAGSGKTAIIAARVVYLALVATGRLPADHPGALPSRILCLTFTNKAVEELARRVRSATEGLGLPEGEEATVLTYHAFAAGLVDDYGLRDGIEPGPMLVSEAHKWRLVSSLLADREFEHLQVRTVAHIVRQTLALANECQNHLVEPEHVAEASLRLARSVKQKTQEDREAVETALERVELAGLVRDYQDRKRELGVIDYGDQISLATQLVRNHPEVGDEFRARFAVVLLDEFQDTNVAQAALLRDLCGRGYPVTAVGDPDQNIYAWRGASLHNILTFLDQFDLGGSGSTRPLYVNFRSGSRILQVADAVIRKVPEERRAKDKELRPHPSRGAGRVLAFVATDERAEARRIAQMIKELLADREPSEEAEPAWRDVAVLCRKKRLFSALAEILREEGIPVEVVDLGGLLQMPEVVDLMAWLRVLDDPGRNVAIARILQGPRWRLGYRDLAALARWSAEHTSHLKGDLPEKDRHPGDVAFSLSEALDHLDDGSMTGLSDEARRRLMEFRDELADVRASARGPLGDIAAGIAEHTGLFRELEAGANPAATSARRNLLNFIDHVAAFSPVEGEASLSTLVSYLDLAEEFEDELEPAQPSEANTVKLLTIHKAKGLEWPIVFVPGLAEHPKSNASIFPDTSRQANPVTQPQTLPFELRGDAGILPVPGRGLKRFREDLRVRGLEEERRLCYVALTRARDVLVVSAAHWYEGPIDGHVPGTFFEEIVGRPECELVARDEAPVENPLVDARRERAGIWPPPARPDNADELFPEGWHRAAQAASLDPEWAPRMAEGLGPEELVAFRQRLGVDVERAELIEARTRPEPEPSISSSLSVSSVLEYLRCPKLFYWSHIRPLPRRPSPTARLGSEVHKWIEIQSRGQTTLLDLDEPPDFSIEERLGEPSAEASLKDAFRSSRFAAMTPLATERPFLLFLDGFVVRGRIDAIFGTPDGRWEVVDYKTGRKPADGDSPLLGLQLDLYALACAEVWHKRAEDLTLTFFYLSTGDEVSRPAGNPQEIRSKIVTTLRSIAAGRFEPTPGEQCRWCDFLSFCDAGRRYIGSFE